MAPRQQDDRVLVFIQLNNFRLGGAQQGPGRIIGVSTLRTKNEAAVHERDDRLRVGAAQGAMLSLGAFSSVTEL